MAKRSVSETEEPIDPSRLTGFTTASRKKTVFYAVAVAAVVATVAATGWKVCADAKEGDESSGWW